MEYMKTKQKAIYFDEKQGEQLLEKFKEEGFIQNKSLEYKIKVKKNEINEKHYFIYLVDLFGHAYIADNCFCTYC